MGEWVDLEAVQAAYDVATPALSTHPKDCTNNCYDGPCDCSGNWQVKSWTFDPAPVPALVAELRVAREVQRCLHERVRDQSALGRALARWDRFTRPDERPWGVVAPRKEREQ